MSEEEAEEKKPGVPAHFRALENFLRPISIPKARLGTLLLYFGVLLLTDFDLLAALAVLSASTAGILAMVRRPSLYLRAGQTELALESAASLANAARGTPQEAVYLISAANIHLGLGEYARAKAALARVSHEQLDSDIARREYFLGLALVYLNVGDPEGSRAMLEAIDGFEDEWSIRLLRGIVAGCQGDLTTAQEHLGRLKLEQVPAPVRPVILATRASLELRLEGDIAQAIAWAEAALSFEPKDVVNRCVLAQAMFANGVRDPDALKLLAKRLDGDTPISPPARAFLLFDRVRMSRAFAVEKGVAAAIAELRMNPFGGTFLARLGEDLEA